jgi:hypothetical protein
MLLAEAIVALAILVGVMLPMAFMFLQETRLCRAAYFKGVAMEIVDGEMEFLAAGEWRAFQPGRQAYSIHASAATNLPPGQFVLTLEAPRVRLEWVPKKPGAGGSVIREVRTR